MVWWTWQIKLSHIYFSTQDTFSYITIIALLCTIQLHLTLCAHKYNHEKVVIKDSQKERAIKNMYGKKSCEFNITKEYKRRKEI